MARLAGAGSETMETNKDHAFLTYVKYADEVITQAYVHTHDVGVSE